MRILLACDIDTAGGGNSFTLQLLHALERHPDTTAVQHGTSWMHVSGVRFDIVHIHWPEALTNWSEPTAAELSDIQEILSRWKRESSIVATVHNEYPHNRDTEAFRALYRMVYTHADGIIHMGNESKRITRKRYADEINKAVEIVIPHGNYSYLSNNISKENARLELNLPMNAKVFLSFGRIRSISEWNLLTRGFGAADISKSRLVVAGKKTFYPSRISKDYWRLWWSLSPASRIEWIQRFVPSGRVQYFMNAADVLVIPRHDAINSGNVALGLTYGNVIVGPDIGVIGEVLRETGNPTFIPDQPDTVSESFIEAIALQNTDLPSRNKAYAEHKLAWGRIAERHVRHYESILREQTVIGDVK